MRKNYFKIYFEVTQIVGILALLTFSINLFVGFLNDYMAGFMMSFGFVLTLFSFINGRNKNYQKEIELSEKDERLKMISEKSYSATYSFHNLLSVILVIVFGFFDQTKAISIGLAGMLFVEWTCLIFMKSYFGKKY